MAKTNTTLNIVMLAVFNLFLSRLAGQKDIVVGSAAAGRTNADLKDVPGMFVTASALLKTMYLIKHHSAGFWKR